eukprot:589227-Pelagomonas_calceolata.AAC.1
MANTSQKKRHIIMDNSGSRLADQKCLILLFYNHKLLKEYLATVKGNGSTPKSWIKEPSMNASKLSNNKSPGPVGVVNEILKMLSPESKRASTNSSLLCGPPAPHEALSLLSCTQAGFRNQTDTIHQLQNVIMGLEDAKMFGKHICALIVDFTSAFNTSDHDRMLWIMYDLGFPTDAIDTVKNLYESATTQ